MFQLHIVPPPIHSTTPRSDLVLFGVAYRNIHEIRTHSLIPIHIEAQHFHAPMYYARERKKEIEWKQQRSK